MNTIDDARLHYTRGLIEVSLDPLVTISPNGKIMDVNAATEKITGLPRDQLVGSDFSIYFTHPDKAQEGYELAFAQGTVKDYPQGVDLACRYGGEEFILVLPEMTTDYALELMEQLRQTVANLTISYHGRFLPQVTVSIGLATFPQHGYSPERLINLADKALYQAKESGRNRTVAYGSSSVPVGVP